MRSYTLGDAIAWRSKDGRILSGTFVSYTETRLFCMVKGDDGYHSFVGIDAIADTPEDPAKEAFSRLRSDLRSAVDSVMLPALDWLEVSRARRVIAFVALGSVMLALVIFGR